MSRSFVDFGRHLQIRTRGSRTGEPVESVEVGKGGAPDPLGFTPVDRGELTLTRKAWDGLSAKRHPVDVGAIVKIRDAQGNDSTYRVIDVTVFEDQVNVVVEERPFFSDPVDATVGPDVAGRKKSRRKAEREVRQNAALGTIDDYS